MAELLAEKGYRTAFAAAGWLAPEFGLLQGQQTTVNSSATHWFRSSPIMTGAR